MVIESQVNGICFFLSKWVGNGIFNSTCFVYLKPFFFSFFLFFGIILLMQFRCKLMNSEGGNTRVRDWHDSPNCNLPRACVRPKKGTNQGKRVHFKRVRVISSSIKVQMVDCHVGRRYREKERKRSPLAFSPDLIGDSLLLQLPLFGLAFAFLLPPLF